MFISHITLSGFSERVLFYILSGILTLAGFNYRFISLSQRYTQFGMQVSLAMALIEVTGFNSRLTSFSGILLRGEVCLAYKTTLTPQSFTEVPVRGQENKGSCICVFRVTGCVFFYDFYMFRQWGIFCFSFYYKTQISLTVFDFIFISIRSSYDLAWCCRYILVFYSSPIFDNYHWFSNLTI